MQLTSEHRLAQIPQSLAFVAADELLAVPLDGGSIERISTNARRSILHYRSVGGVLTVVDSDSVLVELKGQQLRLTDLALEQDNVLDSPPFPAPEFAPTALAHDAEHVAVGDVLGHIVCWAIGEDSWEELLAAGEGAITAVAVAQDCFAWGDVDGICYLTEGSNPFTSLQLSTTPITAPALTSGGRWQQPPLAPSCSVGATRPPYCRLRRRLSWP